MDTKRKGRQSAALQLSTFRSRVEFGDVILLVYFLAVVRQWFWLIGNTPAWLFTIPLAIGCWILYVLTKDAEADRPSPSFWLIVGLPLLAAYFIRAPFPDSSFDVWGLRLFHGDRGLRGFIYLPGEFFPTAAPFNPTPDMITAIFRYLLGYRLGTVVNLFALVWTATILDKLLRPVVGNTKLRALAVLLIVFVEHLLFEINNYMPDLLALPILLEATRLTIENRSPEPKMVLRVAFLISLAVTLKLSNGAVALPLVIIWTWRCVRTLKLKQLATTTLLSLLLLIVPLLPFTIWVYKLTGSPIFPLYNGIFRSPMYPLLNGWDNRWGGYGVFEVLAWPVLIFFKPERAAELPVYSGRLSVAFVVALVGLALIKRLSNTLRIIVFILLVGSLLWSVTMGYIRYGLYLEVLAGLFLVMLVGQLSKRLMRSAVSWRTGIAALLLSVLVAQSVLAAYYVSQREWSMRPTVFSDLNAFKRESAVLLNDRSIRALLSPEERAKFDRVEVWIVSGTKTAGIMPLLNNRARFVGVRWGGLFLAPATRAQLQQTLDEVSDREMWSLAFEPDYEEALKALENTGLSASDREEILIPFFSKTYLVKAYFFRVTRQKSKDATALSDVGSRS